MADATFLEGISPKFNKQILEAKNNIDLTTKSMIELVDMSKKITVPSGLKKFDSEASAQVINLTKALEENRKITVELQREVEKLKQSRDNNKPLSEEERLTKKLTKAKQNLINAQSKEGREIQKVRQQTNLANKESRAAGSIYLEQDVKLKKLIATYRDLALRQQLFNNLTTKEVQQMDALEAEITQLDSSLKKVDAQSGRFFRTMGKSGSQFNGLNNSIAQISRELPAFTVSMQTGFLAISNNLPILADELNRVKAANKELADSGKPTESVFKKLGKAIFSWQTLISVGITLLTIYGAKIVDLFSNLGKSTGILSSTAKAQEHLNRETTIGAEVAEKAAQSASKQISRLELLRSVAEDTALSTKQRREAVEALQKEFPKYFKNIKQESILNGDAKESYDLLSESILNKAKVSAASSLLEENIKQQLQLEIEANRELIKANEQYLTVKETASLIFENEIAQKIANNEITEEEVKLLRKQRQEAKKNFDTSKLSADFQTNLIKQEQSQQRKRQNIIADTIKERDEGINTLKEEQATIIELIKSYGTLGLTYDSTRLKIEKYNDESKESNEIFKSTIESIENLISSYESLIDTTVIGSNRQIQARQSLEDLKIAYEGIINPVNEGLVAFEEYNKSIENGEKALKAYKKSIQDFLNTFSDDFISNTGLKTTFDILNDNITGFGDNFQVTFNAIAESAQEAFNFINQASNNSFNNQIANLEQEKKTALLFAGESAAGREGVEKDYEEKRKEIENERAKKQKDIALFNIAIDTAQAIVSALPNIPLSIAVGAIGLAQAAFVSAQDIPQFKDGHLAGTHVGWSLVNDGGQDEFLERRGQIHRITGRNVLLDMKKGDKIHKSEQSMYSHFNEELNSELLKSGIYANSASISPQIKVVNKGITKREMQSVLRSELGRNSSSIHFDKKGFSKFSVHNLAKQNSLNNKVIFKGGSV